MPDPKSRCKLPNLYFRWLWKSRAARIARFMTASISPQPWYFSAHASRPTANFTARSPKDVSQRIFFGWKTFRHNFIRPNAEYECVSLFGRTLYSSMVWRPHELPSGIVGFQ